MKRPRVLLAAALLLPIVALATGILASEIGARGASVWRIPVAGYDPRDPLRDLRAPVGGRR